ncbi:MAG: protein phosphatase 2C domain-containing protein [Symplocastrum torsivum CPER-KK1]|jgi:serine/threonine protein phosphatase PrpC|uniref:Protein phosphatase 2C domain-containing protein n=1 Tax=Symplocastrum torsivum CPER-KK1 TaxID=450513 RepID=A0A951UD46_9CYAN|nr:protein phosphatase 2C domain-containing protein [Symplocastrum torsivum CPER-KK1]
MSSSEPLMNRYLWAVGSAAVHISAGEQVTERYTVVAPRIWQDIQPELPPEVPEQIGGNILPYLRLYPHRLHIPQVYGVCQVDESVVVLLENAPIDTNGELYPAITTMWTSASAVRQVYWLWQILELWTPLLEAGVASSLLIPDNLRVEGWCLRLRELYIDVAKDTNRELAAASTGNGASSSDSLEAGTASGARSTLLKPPMTASLKQLGECWASWCRKASVSVASQLQEIAEQLQAENPSLKAIAQSLNQLLIEQAARQPLRLQVAGATDTGPRHGHNEDSYYPTLADLPTDSNQLRDPLIPHLSIICDGIGGHEGGEVASQMAVQSIKLQVRALIAELTEDPEIMTPELVAQQLCAIIRVANNLIASCNDQQERESRRRMATTLILALQLPQVVKMADGQGNAHELYIASVGDSRAYWITPRYCQQLTVDDDVATREAKMGRSLYRAALKRPDAGALTQAVGTRDAELLRPTVRRFILEEDGLLLLCSDGLSDNDLVEKFSMDYPRDVFSGKLSLEAAVQALIDLANQKNGHDNTSVVLTYCAVSPQYPVVLNLGENPLGTTSYSFNLDAELAGSHQALESGEAEMDEERELAEVSSTKEWFKAIVGIIGVLLVLVSAGAALLTAQWLLNPDAFKQLRDRFFPVETLDNPQSKSEPPSNSDS